MPVINLIGKRFGKLTVLERGPNGNHGQVRWKCLCDCGCISTAEGSNLRNGHTKSCGGLRPAPKASHGMSNSRTYKIWSYMIQRTTNPNNTSARNYILRGIDVCDRWRSFENFFSDMGERPPGMSIDRIDNEKGYCKENCRWATTATQNRNQRHPRAVYPGLEKSGKRDKWRVKITVKGKTLWVGSFNGYEAAVAARKQAEEKFWKDQASSYSPTYL